MEMLYSLFVVTEYEGHESAQLVGVYVGLNSAKKAGTKADYWFGRIEEGLIGYDGDSGRVHYIIKKAEIFFD